MELIIAVYCWQIINKLPRMNPRGHCETRCYQAVHKINNFISNATGHHAYGFVKFVCASQLAAHGWTMWGRTFLTISRCKIVSSSLATWSPLKTVTFQLLFSYYDYVYKSNTSHVQAEVLMVVTADINSSWVWHHLIWWIIMFQRNLLPPWSGQKSNARWGRTGTGPWMNQFQFSSKQGSALL
jgi:hypothetical protein